MSRYIALNLHKNYLQIAFVDEKGKPLKNNKMENDIQIKEKFFDQINCVRTKSCILNKIVMESSSSSSSSSVWYDIY